mmetsp:Transcript_109627/g.318486  ORF Transcript_109627/g.318486 Transcript_109627/m.318486 type:complete len:758 (+) Transcript_109627:162-2435(+)
MVFEASMQRAIWDKKTTKRQSFKEWLEEQPILRQASYEKRKARRRSSKARITTVTAGLSHKGAVLGQLASFGSFGSLKLSKSESTGAGKGEGGGKEEGGDGDGKIHLENENEDDRVQRKATFTHMAKRGGSGLGPGRGAWNTAVPETTKMRYRDKTLDSRPQESREDAIRRIRADVDRNYDDPTAPEAEAAFEKAIYLADLKAASVHKFEKAEANFMRNAEEDMLMQLLDDKSREDVVHLSANDRIMVFLPVHEFTVTDGIEYRLLYSILAGPLLSRIGLTPKHPAQAAVTIDQFLENYPLCVALHYATLPCIVIGALALLKLVPQGVVWVSLLCLFESFRVLLRCNVEVLERVLQEVFRFWVPVGSLFLGLIFAAVSFGGDPGAVVFLFVFGLVVTVDVFMNDALLMKRNILKPQKEVWHLTMMLTVFALWTGMITVGETVFPDAVVNRELEFNPFNRRLLRIGSLTMTTRLLATPIVWLLLCVLKKKFLPNQSLLIKARLARKLIRRGDLPKLLREYRSDRYNILHKAHQYHDRRRRSTTIPEMKDSEVMDADHEDMDEGFSAFRVRVETLGGGGDSPGKDCHGRDLSLVNRRVVIQKLIEMSELNGHGGTVLKRMAKNEDEHERFIVRVDGPENLVVKLYPRNVVESEGWGADPFLKEALNMNANNEDIMRARSITKDKPGAEGEVKMRSKGGGNGSGSLTAESSGRHSKDDKLWLKKQVVIRSKRKLPLLNGKGGMVMRRVPRGKGYEDAEAM